MFSFRPHVGTKEGTNNFLLFISNPWSKHVVCAFLGLGELVDISHYLDFNQVRSKNEFITAFLKER
jgi:hypothetical protein